MCSEGGDIGDALMVYGFRFEYCECRTRYQFILGLVMDSSSI